MALQQLCLEEDSLLFVSCNTLGLCTVVGTTHGGDTPGMGTHQ